MDKNLSIDASQILHELSKYFDYKVLEIKYGLEYDQYVRTYLKKINSRLSKSSKYVAFSQIQQKIFLMKITIFFFFYLMFHLKCRGKNLISDYVPLGPRWFYNVIAEYQQVQMKNGRF